jgi:hypothetical protein
LLEGAVFVGLVVVMFHFQAIQSAGLVIGVLLVGLFVVNRQRHRKQARRHQEELAITLGLREGSEEEGPLRRLWTGGGDLVAQGTYARREVMVIYEPLPHWRRQGFLLASWLREGTFETRVSTWMKGVDDESDLRIERRKALERTQTSISSRPAEQDRSAFERDHHVYTGDRPFAHAFLDEQLQRKIHGYDPLESLVVWEGEVRLIVAGLADPETVRRGLDLVVAMAERGESVTAREDPVQSGSADAQLAS